MGININGSTDTISATDGNFNLDGTVTNVKAFASGTLMLFQQTSAPTGWTKQTTHNDKALRVVSGAASSGGSTAFTSVFTSRTPAGTVTMTNAAVTLTTSQIASHAHQGNVYAEGYSGGGGAGQHWQKPGTPSNTTDNVTIQNTGGSGSHTHSNTASFSGTALDFAVQYVDLIIAAID